MTVFLGDIAFYMATLVFAVGIYMIHHAKHHDSEQCKLLKSGGYIVTTIALLGMLCTGYYWMKYYYGGSYETSSPQSMQGMMGGDMGNMMPGMMSGKGMAMNPQMMGQMMGTCLEQMPEGMKMDSAMRGKMKACLNSQANSVKPTENSSPTNHE